MYAWPDSFRAGRGRRSLSLIIWHSLVAEADAKEQTCSFAPALSTARRLWTRQKCGVVGDLFWVINRVTLTE
jgi:hypothetical protein